MTRMVWLVTGIVGLLTLYLLFGTDDVPPPMPETASQSTSTSSNSTPEDERLPSAFSALSIRILAEDGTVPAYSKAGYSQLDEEFSKATDLRGEAMFPRVPSMPVKVFGRAPGFEESTTTRPLIPGVRTDVVIHLKPLP